MWALFIFQPVQRNGCVHPDQTKRAVQEFGTARFRLQAKPGQAAVESVPLDELVEVDILTASRADRRSPTVKYPWLLVSSFKKSILGKSRLKRPR